MTQNFVVLALLMTGAVVWAETYHVSPSGNDLSSGTMKKPFRTIQHAAEIMKPGDKCIVRAGVYHEVIRPGQNGTPDNLIRFEVGEEGPVYITGAEPVSAWHKDEGNVWHAEIKGPVEQVFVDGNMIHEACWPNMDTDLLHTVRGKAAKGSRPGCIVDPSIPGGPGAWEGALVHLTPGDHWVSWTRLVKAWNPEKHEIEFDSFAKEKPYEVREGTIYYLTRSRTAFDSPDEWYYDTQSGRLLWIPKPGDTPLAHHVEVKRNNWALDLHDRSNIQVVGFRVFAASVNMSGAENCLLENCHFKYVSHFVACEGWGTGMTDSGLVVGGKGNTVRKCSVAWSAGNGITVLGEGNTVDDCLVHDVNYAATDCAAVNVTGMNQTITHNTLYNAGQSVLLHRMLTASHLEYNHIYNAGLLTADLGCTYAFATDGKGTVIAYNWVHDNHAKTGVGIYIDNNSPNHIVHHNVCWNITDSGIRLNTPGFNETVANNTLFSNGNSFDYWDPKDEGDQTGTQVLNNLAQDRVRFGKNLVEKANFTGSGAGLLDPEKRDFRLNTDSPCIDKGVEVPGITDGFKGPAPDIGAYEFGTEPWKPGHTWGNPTKLEYQLPKHQGRTSR